MKLRSHVKRLPAVLVALAGLGLLLAPAAACGGGGDGSTPAPGTTGTPATATTGTPDGDGGPPPGKILFVAFRDGNQEIYVMNSDGSDERNVTNDPATDFDPDWSTDGTRIAFASDRTGDSEIFTMDADGSNLRQLTDGGGMSPRWSRDGKRIAFARAGDIAVMDADGGNLEIVMEAENQATAADCRAGAFPGGWSPDDSAITYYSASVTRQQGQTCTVTLDGEIAVVITEPEVYNVEPVYSPDGRELVYRGIHDNVHDIWIVNLETGERTNITDDPDLDIEPDWSPDGEWIVYGSIKEGSPNVDIYIMRRDGTDAMRLTDDPTKEANPIWAP